MGIGHLPLGIGTRKPLGDNTISKNLRRNGQIRVSKIRLIGDDNEQLGVVDIRDALQRAEDAGIDLVEVAPQSQPPVCRIMDYGKWMYTQRKKEQKAKAHRHETELKEIRIKTPKIGDHDLEIKVNRARSFLTRGDRVQFSLRFRGRELAHTDEGRKVFQHVTETLSDISKVDQSYRFEGRRLTMTLAPTSKKPGSGQSGKPQAKQAKPAKPAAKPTPKPAAPATTAAPPPAAQGSSQASAPSQS